MKTLIYAAAILCLLPVSAMAQSGPKIEISPGGERKFDQNYDRERDRDQRRRNESLREHDFDHGDKNCKTVIVKENGVTRKTKRCD